MTITLRANPAPGRLSLRSGQAAGLAVAAGLSFALIQPALAQTSAGSRFGLRVHDPATLARQGTDYWCYFTGNGVRSLRSTNLVDWQPGPSVFTNLPPWVRSVVPDHRGHFWAPDLIRARDRWLLYYSVSSWGKNHSAIGLATNPTLDPTDPAYRWTDAGMVIRSFATNNFNAIDPAVTFDAAGRLWLSFGSFWSGIQLVELEPATGLLRAPDSPPRPLAYHAQIEAPFIHRRGGDFFLFVNWGLCCRGTNSTYEIRVGRSAAITGPYRDREGKPLLEGGGTRLLASEGRFVGPGHAGIVTVQGRDWLTFHYYDAEHAGRPTWGRRPLRWDAAGWPLVNESVAAP
jgi:arabinan endo-1,5-alpha-L-arabinosidase